MRWVLRSPRSAARRTGCSPREAALAEAEAEARDKAIAAGAMPETLEVIEREDTPLAYLPGNATRIHVKVVGEMGAYHG